MSIIIVNLLTQFLAVLGMFAFSPFLRGWLVLTYRHSHLCNAIDHDHQLTKKGEASDFLPIIWADGVHMGAQEQGGCKQPHDEDLEGLGFVYHNGSLNQQELSVHQRFPSLQPCCRQDKL